MRDRAKLPDKYTEFLHSFANKFAHDFDAEHYDVSEYHIAIREALVSNVSLPEGLLIPAHFLKSMKELYGAGRHNELISLADRVILRSDYYDNHTRHDILYYLCQSLARKRDPRFTEEVQNIDGPDHDFLFGFYYRIKGSYERAIPRYEKAMEYRRTEQRA